MSLEARKARRQQLRDEWLQANGPCQYCGTWDDLEVDHVDPAQKSFGITFDEGAAKREKELAKCQALCHDCHLEKTAKERHRSMCPRVICSKVTTSSHRHRRSG